MGAAGTRTEPSRAAEHNTPSAKSSFHFLPFLFEKEPPRPAPPAPTPLGRWSQSSFSLRPRWARGPQQGGGQVRGRHPPPPTPHSSPWFPPAAAAFGSRHSRGGGLKRGEKRFLIALLSGALRQGSFPAPAASPSLPSPELGLAEAAREGARAGRHAPAGPRPDRRCRCRRLLSSHGGAPRLRSEDQQVKLGRGAPLCSRSRSRRVPPGWA